LGKIWLQNAKLVKAEERLTDGILFYTFEFAVNDGTHQLLCLSVNKGKIWSLDANSSEKRWSKKEAMYHNVVGSFLPKLT
jgi:photosystem II oxygen-evolving enhancer protein 2